MVEVATVAADQLAAEGIACGVVNARWLKPMDPRLVTDWARRYPLLITAEDHVGTGGFGGAGLARGCPCAARPARVLPHGRRAETLAEHGLDPDGLAGAVRAALAKRTTT